MYPRNCALRACLVQPTNMASSMKKQSILLLLIMGGQMPGSGTVYPTVVSIVRNHHRSVFPGEVHPGR